MNWTEMQNKTEVRSFSEYEERNKEVKVKKIQRETEGEQQENRGRTEG